MCLNKKYLQGYFYLDKRYTSPCRSLCNSCSMWDSCPLITLVLIDMSESAITMTVNIWLKSPSGSSLLQRVNSVGMSPLDGRLMVQRLRNCSKRGSSSRVWTVVFKIETMGFTRSKYFEYSALEYIFWYWWRFIKDIQ